MNTPPRSTTLLFVMTAGMVIVALCAIAISTWWSSDEASQSIDDDQLASEEIVGSFYASLAALDVEENERAARLLHDAVSANPQEPALWANLAVCQLRLNQPLEARKSLQRAIDQSTDSRDIALITAEVYQYSGDIESAIEQFRLVHQAWPENVAVTYSLVSLLGQLSSDPAEAERLALLSDILTRVPGNLRALIEQARVAATLGRSGELVTAIDLLQENHETWPESIQQQFAQAATAARANDFRQAALSLAFFENLMKPRQEYQQSLAQLGMTSLGAVGTPLRSLLRFNAPRAEIADADMQLTFELTEPFETAARPSFVLAVDHPGERRSTLLSLSDGVLHVDESAALSFPGFPLSRSLHCLETADLNNDFRQDLICVGSQGCRILLGTDSGSFEQQANEGVPFDRPWRAVWAIDVDAEGDMDLILSDGESALQWIRNDGDGSYTPMERFLPVRAVASLCSLDFDQDGDVDLVTLDASGNVMIWQNQRGGTYVGSRLSTQQGQVAVAAGDLDQDGQMELLMLDQSGDLRWADWTGDEWTETALFSWKWSTVQDTPIVGEAFLAMVDLDNNGAVDIVTSVAEESSVWLRKSDASWHKLPDSPAMRLTSIVDRNEDGLLDLVGLAVTGERIAINRSQAGYGWQMLQPLASTGAGDKRINSFGVGGQITLRSGSLVQTKPIQSPRVYFGIGQNAVAEVARIVWPNGTTQAEFDLRRDQILIAKQRLKGSCPWVFAFDGSEFRFVKDFIWRSPLGLRINAQATAGVMQTEDWIKIRGDQLAEVNGRYQIRITAELWETHFFDHVSLLAIDHAPDVDVFVDERFVPQDSPDHEIITLTPLQPLGEMVDDLGNRLDAVLRSNDGVYADGFPLGEFQGVAAEHWVAFTLPANVSSDREVRLVGQGWIYPTDSSLNVAIDQGDKTRPFGLVLEQQHPSGNWHELHAGLGFPSGKNKDVVLDLPSESLKISRRFRVRTNMEVYWDSLRWGYVASDAGPSVKRLAMMQSTLRYRGFSRLLPMDRRRPDTPVYELAGTQPRWLDLEGFYTRFGDVDELLDRVDDRYVIANAGDELAFEFDAGEGPAEGMERDFVLVGDGWVKDGDLNTSFSQTVRPLPAHHDSEYQGPIVPLEEDRVYQRFPNDWLTYHSRYVSPEHFFKGLWQPQRPEIHRQLP